MIATGGKSLYGAAVGVLMLDAQFPRILGDMGNAMTWPFPVHFRVVRDASPDAIVRRGTDMLDAFIAAGRHLIRDGADGITTTCGFLSLYQTELADALGVPVATSSLMQVAGVNALLPRGKRAGILTISGSSLTAAHLAAADVPENTPIGSTEGGTEFTRAILGNEPRLDVNAARADNVNAALALQSANPDLGAIVLECTNMLPYAADISAATGLPVWSMYSFITWFQSGLAPRKF